MGKVCKICKITFLKPVSNSISTWNKRKYCSQPCANKDKTYWKGKKIPKEVIAKMVAARKANGFLPWNKGKVGLQKCSEEQKRIKSLMYSGSGHPQYIHDRTKLAKRQIRNDSAYKEWRKNVWLRDKWKCKIANPDCGGRIEAHHILGWKDYPELRYQINNGITLCHAHHPLKKDDAAKLSPYFQKLVASLD